MMHADDIFKKIGFILNDLQDQQEYLAHHPEKVNVPEMELFLANANFLADHVKVYVKLKSQELAEVKETARLEEELPMVAVEISGEPVDTMSNEEESDEVAEIEEIESRVDMESSNDGLIDVDENDDRFSFDFEVNDEPASEKFDYEEKPVEELFNRVLTEDEKLVIATKKNTELTQEESEIEERGPEPFLIPVAAEEIEAVPHDIQELSTEPAKKLTINELLAANKTGSVNSSPKKAPVTDLKQAINLNDKLLFIKDLFNGYNLAYAEAIEIINKLPDFTAADNFLQKNYAMKNEWAAKQATTDRFYELLNLRFPPETK